MDTIIVYKQGILQASCFKVSLTFVFSEILPTLLRQSMSTLSILGLEGIRSGVNSNSSKSSLELIQR